MTFQRIVEMAIKPPFKYYVVRDGYFGNAVADKFCYNSLSKAKEIIKIMKRLLFNVCGYIAIPFEKKVNDFLKEIEK